MTEEKPAGKVEGGCYCGRIRFEAELPSKFCCHCHCENCRRAHGAAFVTWVGFQKDRFRFTAGEEHLVRYVTETEATRSFCGVCGTTLLYESPRWPDDMDVVLSNIDGGIDQAPQAHVYVDSRASWWTIQDDLPQMGGETGMEPKSGG